MRRARAGDARRPSPSPSRQRGAGQHHPVRGLEHDFGERLHRIEQVAVQADVELARVGALDRQPVDEVGIGRAAEPVEQRFPRGERVDPPGERMARAFDPRAALRRRASRARPRPALRAARRAGSAAGGSRPARSPPAAPARRSCRRAARPRSRCRSPLPARRSRRARKSTARTAASSASIGPNGLPSASRCEPAVAGQRLGRLARLRRSPCRRPRRSWRRRPAARRGPRRRPREPFSGPTIQRLSSIASLPGQRGGEGAVGRLEHVVAFVEHDPRRALRVVAAARGVDHHQRVVGDHQVGLRAGARGALDEALPVMRAAGIDAFAALVGQRADRAVAEQRAEPAGQVAADHVAVLADRPPSARPAAPGSPRARRSRPAARPRG